jgi:3-hydroxyisobutyrate dehydrogenase
VFFFGSNNYGWIEEKSLRPFDEYREEMKSKGKPKEQFMQAMNDIESFIENPENFSALFEPKPVVQKKKASPKPKKQDIELDFDSLKSDSSVPSSPNIAKATATTPQQVQKRSSSIRSVEKTKSIEKPSKVPAEKRKATREYDQSEDLEPLNDETPSKKPRKSSQNPSTSPQRKEPAPELSRIALFEDVKQNSPREPMEASRTVFGFIGLGILGRNILDRLLKSGHDVVIWNRNNTVCHGFVENYGSQCNAAMSPKDVFEQAQITFVCVADCDAVKETICDGDRGIIAADNQSLDKGLVMLSSIDCETSRDINNALMMKGPVRYLEAQIQGSRNQATSGSLIVIAAGDKTLYHDCESCFKSMAKDSHYLGDEIGAAVKMNLVLQTMAGVQLAAVAEAFALADSFELQLRDILEIIGISNLNSEFIMEKGDVIIKDQFRDPAMKVNTMQKDLKMAIEFGDEQEQPLPLATSANEIFKSAKRLGFGQEDVASIYIALSLKYGTEANGI